MNLEICKLKVKLKKIQLFLGNLKKNFSIFSYFLNLIQYNLLIISEIWLIQIAKKRFLWICEISLITSVENIFPLMNQSKLTDLTFENIPFTGESVKMQITDAISEIWLIQIAKKRLLWICEVSLITSVKIIWLL